MKVAIIGAGPAGIFGFGPTIIKPSQQLIKKANYAIFKIL